MDTPPISPVVVNKVPKTVKSLQSACFLSSENHTLTVLKDCARLIHNAPDLQYELLQFDAALPSLLHILQAYEDVAAVQHVGCQILADLAQHHDDLRLYLAQDGALQAILVALLKHEDGMDVQVAGLTALAHLAQHYDNKLTHIPELNGLEVLATCMQAYTRHLPVQIQVCRALAALAEIPAHSRALGALRLPHTLVQVLQELLVLDVSSWKGSSSVEQEEVSLPMEKQQVKEQRQQYDFQLHACAAIEALTLDNELNQQQLGPAIPLLLAIVQQQQHEQTARNKIVLDNNNNTTQQDAAPKLIAKALRALWNLTTHQPDHVQEILSYDYQEGVRIVLTAMKHHVHDADVQQAGCGVLRNLTHDPASATLVGRALGAISVVLNAMRQHQDKKAVQASGCGTLCHLAVVDEFKAPILNAGGVGFLVQSMKVLPESVDVQKSACQALKHLALDNEQNQVSIAASGGIAAMLAAMERHPNQVAVQVLAVGALSTLMEVPRNRATALREHAVDILQRCLEKHAKSCPFLQQVGQETYDKLRAETTMG